MPGDEKHGLRGSSKYPKDDRSRRGRSDDFDDSRQGSSRSGNHRRDIVRSTYEDDNSSEGNRHGRRGDRRSRTSEITPMRTFTDERLLINTREIEENNRISYWRTNYDPDTSDRRMGDIVYKQYNNTMNMINEHRAANAVEARNPLEGNELSKQARLDEWQKLVKNHEWERTGEAWYQNVKKAAEAWCYGSSDFRKMGIMQNHLQEIEGLAMQGLTDRTSMSLETYEQKWRDLRAKHDGERLSSGYDNPPPIPVSQDVDHLTAGMSTLSATNNNPTEYNSYPTEYNSYPTEYAAPHSSTEYAAPYSPTEYAAPHSSTEYTAPHSSTEYTAPHSSTEYTAPHSGYLHSGYPHSGYPHDTTGQWSNDNEDLYGT